MDSLSVSCFLYIAWYVMLVGKKRLSTLSVGFSGTAMIPSCTVHGLVMQTVVHPRHLKSPRIMIWHGTKWQCQLPQWYRFMSTQQLIAEFQDQYCCHKNSQNQYRNVIQISLSPPGNLFKAKTHDPGAWKNKWLFVNYSSLGNCWISPWECLKKLIGICSEKCEHTHWQPCLNEWTRTDGWGKCKPGVRETSQT